MAYLTNGYVRGVSPHLQRHRTLKSDWKHGARWTETGKGGVERKSVWSRFKAIPPVATFLRFRKRPAPELQDLPTYALCLWASLCTGEALGISYLLYQIGKIFDVYSLPLSSDLTPLLHQSLSFYLSATITLVSVIFFATMGVIFAKLSSESGKALWQRVNGKTQANWRARSIRHKYFPRKKRA